MPLTKYTYSISTDFPNAKVNSDSLTVEIDDSTVVGLSHIDTHADDCDIWFHNALDPGSKTVLDGIVAAHQGEPLPPLVKRAIGESLGEITTNTTTWWEKLTVLLVRVEPGTFKIHWTCQFQNSRNKSIKLRIQVDNSITVM
ncbi:MAG: hypothetical protein MJA29_04020, partial [Candidatus Omnitrophica bacterium]|nr:hypothetical protein [Candidatus Omnitrophota bacterium]